MGSLKQAVTAFTWFPKSHWEQLRFVNRKVVSLAGVLERGVGRESGEKLLWTEETYLSPTLTPYPIPCICHVTHCHNTAPSPVTPGLSLWPELEAGQHHKSSEHSSASEMVPCLSARLPGKWLPSPVVTSTAVGGRQQPLQRGHRDGCRNRSGVRTHC